MLSLSMAVVLLSLEADEWPDGNAAAISKTPASITINILSVPNLFTIFL